MTAALATARVRLMQADEERIGYWRSRLFRDAATLLRDAGEYDAANVAEHWAERHMVGDVPGLLAALDRRAAA